MTKNKIQCKNKTRVEMCGMIVAGTKKNKHLDEMMCSEDFDGEKSHDESDEGEEEEVTAGGEDGNAVKKLKRSPKGSKAREISEEGSLLPPRITPFCQSAWLESSCGATWHRGLSA
jgi:hypothetical protein